MAWVILLLASKGHAAPPSEASQLIDSLTQAEGALGGWQWANDFAATDPELTSRNPHGARPNASMRKLVAMGVDALPDLLLHLKDPRPTKIQVSGFDGLIWMTYYNPRVWTWPISRYVGRLLPGGGLESPYQVRVGDLCLDMIGQIVNRRQKIVMEVPTQCALVSSPIHSPELADSALHDWTGLTKDQLRKSLEQDCLNFTHDGSRSALKRLCYYFPSSGQRMALRLLARRPVNAEKLRGWVARFYQAKSKLEWSNLSRRAKIELGADQTDLLPYFANDAMIRQGETKRQRWLKVVRGLSPPYNPFREAYHRYVPSFQDQIDVVVALEHVPNRKYDRIIHRIFLRSVGWHEPMPSFIQDRDALAFACAARLRGRTSDVAYRTYFQKRIHEITLAGSVPENPAYLRSYVDAWHDMGGRSDVFSKSKTSRAGLR